MDRIDTIFQTSQLSDVSVSYNRASGLLHFSNIPEPCKLVVTSMSGYVVKDLIVNDESSIPLFGMPTGMYVATISKNGKVVASYKFVK